jgi:Mce-associated membrane protein
MSYELGGDSPKGSSAAAAKAGRETAEDLVLLEDVLLVEGVVLGEDMVRHGSGAVPEPAGTKTHRPKADGSKPTKAKSAKAKSGGAGKPGSTAARPGPTDPVPAQDRSAPLALVASEDDPDNVDPHAWAAPLALVASDPDDAPTPTPSGTASASEDAAAAPGDVEAPSHSWLARVRRLVVGNFPAAVLGTVAVAMVVALVLTMLQLGSRSALDNARVSALAAAKTYSVEIARYDYRHLDADFGIVLANSTPSFRRSFTQSSDALKSTLTKYHASASAKVVAAGLVSASTSQALALVFLDQSVMNSAQKSRTTDRSQVEITLVYSGGKWLIDQVTLL